MKQEKGVTLISLITYIIGLLLVIAMITVISSFFYNNINKNSISINPITEYTKFNGYFTEEVNHNNIKVLENKTTFIDDTESKGIQNSYIVFDNEVQYTFILENQGIYRNNVKICSKVESCKFENKIKNGKNIVTVEIKMKNSQNKKVDYILK